MPSVDGCISTWLHLHVASIAFRSYTHPIPTWDESKRLTNIRKHGFDFQDCEAIFDGPVVVDEDARDRCGELRLNATGWLNGQVVVMAYAERDDDFHVIGFREAKKHEIRRYIKETTR
ncbi:MAG: BrnT family toxin [Polyangiaceae bacterium]|nr:BrnT family toxin [Polyangiaceae bacterium]